MARKDPGPRSMVRFVGRVTGTDRTCVIACSREAKLLGVKNVMKT